MHGTTTTEERVSLEAALDEAVAEQAQTMWEREVAFETAMCDDGREQFFKAYDKSKDRKQLAHVGAYRRLTKMLLEPVDAALKAWLVEWKPTERGARKAAYRYLKDFPTDVATLITIREVLDRTGETGEMRLTTIAKAIGSRIQAEARMLAWQKDNPKLWEMTQTKLERQHATPVHRQRVNINRFNKKVREVIRWQEWAPDKVIHVGTALIEQLVVGSGGRFRLEQGFGTAAHDANTWALTMDEELLEALLDGVDTEAARQCRMQPTIIKPKPWTKLTDGGYHTELLRGRRHLIRFKASNEEQQGVATRELSHTQMPEVYDAINTVQDVPWRINARVLQVAAECWERKLEIAGLPSQTAVKPELVMPRPDGFADETAERMWRRRRTDLHKANALLPSRCRKVRDVLAIADRYKDEVFYFPHFFDFRGRMYPMPELLQPQGDDLARGLLTFANGKPVDDTTSYWLAIQLANVWGMDKLPFEERYRWVLSQQDMWLSIYADPMADMRWASSPGEEYWQALAAALEWARYLYEGAGMISSLPIRVDGTCNGIQHLAAMVRDEVAGESVNLVPDDQPHDIYLEVGSVVQGMCESLLGEDGYVGDMARRWLEACGGKFPRAMTKRPVMIFPYGGTKDAYRTYVREWMAEYDPEHTKFPADFETENEMLSFIVTALWEGVGSWLERPREVQKWLQVCAGLAANSGVGVRWQTPCGFVVRHFYGARKERRIRIHLDGQELKLVDWETTAILDNTSFLKGIPPNFVHSMDASVLMTTINKAWRAEIDSLTCIHDSYGTVAADMELLNVCLRQAFVWTYEHSVLNMFRDECMAVLDDDYVHREAMPAVPEMGALDINRVLDSDYFFA